MCGGAHFQYSDDYMRMYFPNPKAMLPVLKKDGSIVLLPWGRRQAQDGAITLGISLRPITGMGATVNSPKRS
ncbi:MAG: hypothetical protein M1270_00090, partial [Gammaproteobacteria bacterium]|nr:hypothetical protein [Gammaproteobacteria bacterium]